MDNTRAVRARALTKTFGDVVALDGVDLDILAAEGTAPVVARSFCARSDYLTLTGGEA